MKKRPIFLKKTAIRIANDDWILMRGPVVLEVTVLAQCATTTAHLPCTRSTNASKRRI